jgi:AcrR family transcriptional regulator
VTSNTTFVKQAYHHKDLRNALIDEALSVLASEGSAALTLRELGRRLGVTHTAPYAHFADKRALLHAVSDAGFERLGFRLERAETTPEPVAALEAMGQLYIAFARENANLYRLMFTDSELADDPECELSVEGARAFAALMRVLERIGPPAGIDLRDLSATVWSMVHGIAMLEIDQRINEKTLRSAEEVLRLGVGLLLAGMRA